MSNKKSSLIYHDLLSVVEEMPDDMAGKFVKSLLALMKGEDIEQLDFSLKIALHPFVAQFKRDNEKYEAICARNRVNGINGGRPSNPKNPAGKSGTQDNPKNLDTDTDTDTDNKLFLSDSNEVRLSKLLYSKILLRNPEHKEPNIQGWAKNIDYMIRIDKRDPQKIANVIDWAQSDSFWQDNILSTNSLRKQYDALVLKMMPKQSQGDQNQLARELAAGDG